MIRRIAVPLFAIGLLVIEPQAGLAQGTPRALPGPQATLQGKALPTTDSLERVQVAFRAVIQVEPREDACIFEVLLQVVNLDRVTWIPTDVGVDLPTDATAYAPGMSDLLRTEPLAAGRVRLAGAVLPGEHQTSFSFQVPRAPTADAHFTVGLPPRIAAVEVLALAGSSTQLVVSGFPLPTRTRSTRGDPILVTERQALSAADDLSRLDLTLSGLPTRGSGRTVALILALVCFVGGLLVAWRGRRPARSRLEKLRDIDQARDLILHELLLITPAPAAQRKPPPSLEPKGSDLLDRLARLDLLRETYRKPPRRQRPLRSH
jgi:hypothetical protein